MKIQFVADESARLDALIARMAPDYSRSQIKRAIEDGMVCVAGKPATKASKTVREGEEIACELPELCTDTAPQAEDGIYYKLVFEDEHLLVIDKPSGLVVHPGAGNPSGTLINGILSKYPQIAEVGERERPGIVHRIDAETSGLLIIAKTQQAYDALVPMFAEHRIHRQYWAICLAPKLPDSGHIDTPYGRHPTQRVKYSSKFDAPKRAITDYKVVDRSDRGFALVTCLLQTGRTHQVRVHLSDNGAPILGDSLYAPQNVLKLKCIHRLALHAGKLMFEHPITGEHCEFESPFPQDFCEAMRKLGISVNA